MLAFERAGPRQPDVGGVHEAAGVELEPTAARQRGVGEQRQRPRWALLAQRLRGVGGPRPDDGAGVAHGAVPIVGDAGVLLLGRGGPQHGQGHAAALQTGPGAAGGAVGQTVLHQHHGAALELAEGQRASVAAVTHRDGTDQHHRRPGRAGVGLGRQADLGGGAARKQQREQQAEPEAVTDGGREGGAGGEARGLHHLRTVSPPRGECWEGARALARPHSNIGYCAGASPWRASSRG